MDAVISLLRAHYLGLLALVGALLASIITAKSAVTGRFRTKSGEVAVRIGSGNYFLLLFTNVVLVIVILLIGRRLW